MKYGLICSTAIIATGLSFCGCAVSNGQTTETPAVVTQESESKGAAQYAKEDTDYSYDESKCKKINLSAPTAAEGVEVSGKTITITKGGAYVVTGKLDGGQLAIKATKNDVVRIILKNAEIYNANGAAINAVKADKTIITLAEGTKNSLSDGEEYVYPDETTDEPDAALFAKDDLTINGDGALDIKGNYKNGVCSKDNLVITGGDINVTAKKDAIKGRDGVMIANGAINAKAGEDGVKANNDEDEAKGFAVIDGGVITLDVGDDGIHAETDLTVNGGVINIVNSYEGLEGARVTINGGDINLKAEDDGINAADGNGGEQGGGRTRQALDAEKPPKGAPNEETAPKDAPNGEKSPKEKPSDGNAPSEPNNATSEKYIKITGGVVTVDAGGDGLDANGKIYMDGGVVFVNGPTDRGNSAIDFDSGMDVTGGVLAAAGSSAMAGKASDGSTQPCALIKYAQAQSAGKTVALVDQNGKIAVAFAPAKSYDCVTFTSPNMEIGAKYSLYSGATLSGNASGGYVGGEIDGGEKLCDITLSKANPVYNDDGSEGQVGGFGGRGGGERKFDGEIPADWAERIAKRQKFGGADGKTK